MTGPVKPTPRRIVALWSAVGLVAVLSLVGLAELLRFDHPLAGPQTPEVTDAIDPLRQDVECALPQAREGEDRPEAVAEPALPEPITSNQLYDCPATWDGRRVVYTGEAVGAILQRSGHAWVQLNDDVYADAVGPLPTHRDFRGGNAGIGAKVPLDLVVQIQNLGGSRQHGDLVEVVGTFERVDEDTGEVAILAVQELRVIRSGVELAIPDHGLRTVVALIAVALLLGVFVLERRNREDV